MYLFKKKILFSARKIELTTFLPSPQRQTPFQILKKRLKVLSEEERPYFLATLVLQYLRSGKTKLARQFVDALCTVSSLFYG